MVEPLSISRYAEEIERLEKLLDGDLLRDVNAFIVQRDGAFLFREDDRKFVQPCVEAIRKVYEDHVAFLCAEVARRSREIEARFAARFAATGEDEHTTEG